MDRPRRSIKLNKETRRREEPGGSTFQRRFGGEDRPNHKRDTSHSVLRVHQGRKSTLVCLEGNAPLESPEYPHANVVNDLLSKQEDLRSGAYG